MTITNIILYIIVLLITAFAVYYFIKKKKEEPVEETINVDDKTYTLDAMRDFVKRRLDEITKVNLYDIGLSEEELKRRKNKKYELKKALKGCTYGDVNDKKYVKELIYDLLAQEYGVDETNISKAIPFDIPSLLTARDKFDILIYVYKKEFGYEALTEMIKKYDLAELKYIEGETKPSYVITEQEIEDIYENEKVTLTFADKLAIVVQRIYQHYKGYSSIDEVRDMNIDGVSGGVSGLPESFLSQVAQTDGDYLNQIAELKRATLEQLVRDPGKEDAIQLLKFLVKGARITSITGEQGSGKTTLLMGMIENIYETMNIRVQETAFELHLRKIYPTRNILTFRETDTISGQEGLDVQKKTDGSVNIIGEVATDPVASWMIQAAQVASKFTLFTHHAKTFPNLVTALRNSMLRTGVFTDEKTAEEQVVQVLNFDIHQVKDFRGKRYIERITECIPVEDKNEYTFDHRKEKTLEGKFDKFFDNATHFFTKTTDKQLYTYRNIMEYIDGEYVITNPITDENIKEMRNNMDETDVEAFDKFIEKHWAKKSNETVTVSSEAEKPKRGRKPKQV